VAPGHFYITTLVFIFTPDEPETRDAWWSEVRMEIRSHARALGCHAVIGYYEVTSIWWAALPYLHSQLLCTPLLWGITGSSPMSNWSWDVRWILGFFYPLWVLQFKLLAHIVMVLCKNTVTWTTCCTSSAEILHLHGDSRHFKHIFILLFFFIVMS